MGLSFRVIPADIDEHHDGLSRPHAIARSIALRKAREVAKRHPYDWIIACDTLVYLSDGKISLKPRNRAEARKILKSYQACHCDVYSGLTLMHHHKKITVNGFERTRIHFKDFSDVELKQYLEGGEWVGRSGAMTIESRLDWIERLDGDYWNVVGMPIDLLRKQLKKQQLV